MTKKVIQTWNFNLEEAEGKGCFLLAGINKSDGSRWWTEAIFVDGKWIQGSDLEELPTANINLIAWTMVTFPF